MTYRPAIARPPAGPNNARSTRGPFTPDQIPGAATLTPHRAAGWPVGYWWTCDDILCESCHLAAQAGPGSWEATGGFESWEEPLGQFDHDATDSPNHCAECGRIIPADLTAEGEHYIAEAADDGGPITASWLMHYAPHELQTDHEWWKAEQVELVRTTLADRLAEWARYGYDPDDTAPSWRLAITTTETDPTR